MDAIKDSKKSNKKATNNTFTFTWKIEDISLCSQEHKERLWSPFFKIMMLDGTVWSICLYPKGLENKEHMSCYLYRLDGMKELMDVEFTLCTIAKDGRQHFIQLLHYTFDGASDTKGISNFFKISEDTKETEYWLPNGTLTIQCKIWKKLTDTITANSIKNKDTFSGMFLESSKKLTDQECFILETKMKHDFKASPMEYSAVTKIAVTTFSFYFWGILTEQCVVPISSPNGTPCLLPTMSIKTWGRKKYILLRIQNLSQKSFHTRCKVDLLNTSGDVLHTVEKANFFDVTNVNCTIHIRPNINKSIFTQAIKIKLEIKTSLSMDFTGVSESRSNSSCVNTFIPDDFKRDILALYRDQKECDFTIVSTDEKEFHAHKLILSTRSPVFVSMLKDKSQKGKVVKIADVDSDILHLILEYIYSSEFVETEPEVAQKLYLAAEKFQLLRLRDHCSRLLKKKLCIKNVCDILQLADTINDRSLKMTVMDFISDHASEVFATFKWQSLIKQHELSELVTEVFGYLSQIEIQTRTPRLFNLW